MGDPTTDTFQRIPGLYRLWDLPMILARESDWQIHYAELTEDGTPLFALYRRSVRGAA